MRHLGGNARPASASRGALRKMVNSASQKWLSAYSPPNEKYNYISEGDSCLSKVLASVGIFVEKSKKQDVLSGLCKIDNIKEVYDVAGEYDILSIVSVSSLAELRDTLQRQILRVKGVRSVITNVILAPHEKLKKVASKPKA